MFCTYIYILIYSLFRLLISVHPWNKFSITPGKRAQHTQIYLPRKLLFALSKRGYQKRALLENKNYLSIVCISFIRTNKLTCMLFTFILLDSKVIFQSLKVKYYCNISMVQEFSLLN